MLWEDDLVPSNMTSSGSTQVIISCVVSQDKVWFRCGQLLKRNYDIPRIFIVLDPVEACFTTLWLECGDTSSSSQLPFCPLQSLLSTPLLLFNTSGTCSLVPCVLVSTVHLPQGQEVHFFSSKDEKHRHLGWNSGLLFSTRWSWASYLIFTCLNFLTCERGDILLSVP